MSTTVKLTHWEISEIKKALQTAVDDGVYDDDLYGAGNEIARLQVQLSRALERIQKATT